LRVILENMDFTDKIKEYLKRHISRERYRHTLNVAKLAVKIARKHGIKDLKKIEIAAFLHDCNKNSKTGLNHSAVSSETAKKVFKIKDKRILDAIQYHTFGSRNMGDFSKIIYIADISEPCRKFQMAKKIRQLALKNIDAAMVLSLAEKIKYVVSKREQLSVESVKLYNKLTKPRNIKK